MTAQLRFYHHLMSYMGLPYIWGGSDPSIGLDCSGLAQLAYARIGLDPVGDQTADALYRHLLAHGTKVIRADLGTAVFYGGSAHITHVGIALGDTHMVEAGGGGSDVTTAAIAAAKGAEVRIARIDRRPDLVAMVRPRLPWMTT